MSMAGMTVDLDPATLARRMSEAFPEQSAWHRARIAVHHAKRQHPNRRARREWDRRAIRCAVRIAETAMEAANWMQEMSHEAIADALAEWVEHDCSSREPVGAIDTDDWVLTELADVTGPESSHDVADDDVGISSSALASALVIAPGAPSPAVITTA
jgi:hypothetical protein